MYLDNVIKSAQAASMPEVTYSEIMEDTLHMVEVEGAGQLALLKAEATAHIMGSESPADWWAKIKTVARKIFEMLKNLITKVFAFIKALPAKIGTLITRLLTQWEKLGMKGKVERFLKKKDLKVRYNTAQDVKGRDFGAIYGGYGSDFGAASEAAALKTALMNWGKASEDAMKAIEALSKDDNDKLSEQIQDEKEKVIKAEEAYRDAYDDFNKAENKRFDSIFPDKGKVDDNTPLPSKVSDLVVGGWNLLKNKTIEKQAEKEIRNIENGTRTAASKYRTAMAAYERYVRDEDEDGVRNALDAAKFLRSVVANQSREAAVIGRLYYRDALVVAKIVNAGLSCAKGGESKGKKEYH
jgi:hypothetical protein